MKLKTSWIVLTSMILALLNFGSANAGGIFTPIIFIGGNDQLICIANNVSSSPITVRVKIIGFFASSTNQTCTLPAGDKDGCQQFLNGESGHCQITASNISNTDVRARVRGVLFSRITTAPFTVDTVVQAE